MKPAIIVEMACTKYVCGQLQAELWPDASSRPYLVIESASGMSAAHRDHFQAIAASNSGRMISPVLSKHGVDPSDVSQVALVGFSAGCWGVAEMLADPDASIVSAVLCVDGLHYPTGSKFEAFARRAAAGSVLMVDTYSAIPVTGYTSTRDSAERIAGVVGAPLVEPLLPGSDQSYRLGNFVAVGFPGTDAPAHVAQVQNHQVGAWKTWLGPWLSEGRQPGQLLPSPPSELGPTVGAAASGALVTLSVAMGIAAVLGADWAWGLSDKALRKIRG